MKKESTIVKENNIYDLRFLIGNTALMRSITGISGLVNVKSKEIVGSFDHFYTIYDDNNNLYFQEKVIPHESGDYSRRKLSVRIYDALNEKMIIDNWLVIWNSEKNYKDGFRIAIVQNPTTGKYRLFNISAYRKETNPFEEEYDDIKYLYEDYNGGINFAFTKNGKVGIYSTKKGFITPIKYDNIENFADILIFTEGKYKFFTGVTDKNYKEFTSPLFEDIVVDVPMRHGFSRISYIFYCKRNSMIEIYCFQRFLADHKCCCKLMFTTSMHDEIRCVYSHEDVGSNDVEYHFLVKDGEKYGLIYGGGYILNDNETSFEKITDVIYDDVVCKKEFMNSSDNSRCYFLKRDDKVGMFKGNYKKSYTIDCKYDNIIEIGDNYYELFYGEFCDIINLTSPNNPIITNCKVVKNLSGNVIFEKNGKKGIVMISYDGTKIFEDYDEVEYLGGEYFKIQKNGKVGIIYNKEIIIEPTYRDINLHGDSDFEHLENSNVMYFALEKDNGKYDLAKLTKGFGIIKFLNNVSYNSVELYNDIMVFRDDNNAYLFNYKEVLLNTFPANVEIVPTTVKRGKAEISLYCVNGVYFFYRNDKFEEAFMEECDLYVTTYETETDSFEIKTFNKEEHDSFCEIIESQEDSAAEESLIDIFENSENEVRQQYHTLVLKRTLKQNKPSKK